MRSVSDNPVSNMNIGSKLAQEIVDIFLSNYKWAIQ